MITFDYGGGGVLAVDYVIKKIKFCIYFPLVFRLLFKNFRKFPN